MPEETAQGCSFLSLLPTAKTASPAKASWDAGLVGFVAAAASPASGSNPGDLGDGFETVGATTVRLTSWLAPAR